MIPTAHARDIHEFAATAINRLIGLPDSALDRWAQPPVPPHARPIDHAQGSEGELVTADVLYQAAAWERHG